MNNYHKKTAEQRRIYNNSKTIGGRAKTETQESFRSVYPGAKTPGQSANIRDNLRTRSSENRAARKKGLTK